MISRKKPWSLLWLIAIQIVVDILVIYGAAMLDVSVYKPSHEEPGCMFPVFFTLAVLAMSIITLVVIIAVLIYIAVLRSRQKKERV